MTESATSDLPAAPNPASEGAGPLLQRDYWAAFADCPLTPRQVADVVAHQFCTFPPPAIVRFERDDDGVPLAVGTDMRIDIRGAGRCSVRVTHRDANSITLLTLAGHPEAGRITFGCYRDDARRVVFHIRSRARASTTIRLAEYVAVGEAMQTSTWTDFINRLAATLGCTVDGEIHATSEEVEASAADSWPGLHEPTFLARGD